MTSVTTGSAAVLTRLPEPPPWTPAGETGPHPLDEIYDDEIEVLTRQAYQRDYITFGFDRWK